MNKKRQKETGSGAEKQRLHVYVDESGQDTNGLLFVVSVLTVEKDLDILHAKLEAVEIQTGKKNIKWHKARSPFRQAYIEKIGCLPQLRHSIFFDQFKESKEYLGLTAFATAKAILKKARGDYKVTVSVDGLNRREAAAFTRTLRTLHIHTRRVRGIRKDENDAFIRLVDSVCGLIRDAHGKNPWATNMLKQLEENELVIRL